jgi:hypothetical protein
VSSYKRWTLKRLKSKENEKESSLLHSTPVKRVTEEEKKLTKGTKNKKTTSKKRTDMGRNKRCKAREMNSKLGLAEIS